MNLLTRLEEINLNTKYVIYALTAGLIFTVISLLDHVVIGNGLVFPVHAVSFLESGNFNFAVPNENGGDMELNFHTPLYTFWITFFLFLTSAFYDLDPIIINSAIKLANSILILITAWVFSLFFTKKNDLNKLMFSAYLVLPMSLYAFISVDMDQVMVPLFLLSAFYFIENKKSKLLTCLFFSLAILTKENTSIVFMLIIIFCEIFIYRNLSIISGLLIGVSALVISYFSYLIICYFFNLDPSTLFTTEAQLKAATFGTSSIVPYLQNAFVQTRLMIQTFSPIVLCLPFILLLRVKWLSSHFIFLFILFFSVFGVSLLTGYVNLRYFSSIAPIMLILTCRLVKLNESITLLDFVLAFTLSLIYVIVVQDQYLYFSDLDSLPMNSILIKLAFLVSFSVLVFFLTMRLNFNHIIVFSISSFLLMFNLGLRDYQLQYDHGKAENLSIFKTIGNNHVFSDTPSAALYLRNNMTYITPAISHWHSKYSMTHEHEKDLVSEERESFLLNKASKLGHFFIWTRSESGNQYKFFLKENECKSFEDVKGYSLLECKHIGS